MNTYEVAVTSRVFSIYTVEANSAKEAEETYKFWDKDTLDDKYHERQVLSVQEIVEEKIA